MGRIYTSANIHQYYLILLAAIRNKLLFFSRLVIAFFHNSYFPQLGIFNHEQFDTTTYRKRPRQTKVRDVKL